MVIPPRLRKLVLTLHIASSVGWFGAVAAYIALDLTAVISDDVQLVRAAYLAMGLTIWYAVVPLAIASVPIGVVNALSSPWGLFRHYWVLVKLLLTVFATIVLLQYVQTVSYFAGVVAETDSANLGGLRSYVLHSGGGLLVLLVTTTLSVYKPQGMTPYGWRKQQEERRKRHEQRAVSQP
jgi:hypothetical protein